MFFLPILLSLLTLITCGWYFNRRRLPPGPPALPLLGCLPFLDLSRGLVDWSTDPRVTNHRLATLSLGPRNTFVINDLKLARELFEREEFSNRSVTEWLKVFKIVNGKIRGILTTSGEDWLSQRRFGLKTLRDLGFGRRTIEEIVDKEIDVMVGKLGNHCGKDYRLGSDFNIPVINVLWQLVAGYRFEESDSQGSQVINSIQNIFKTYFELTVIPLGLTKLFRRTFFEENLKIVENQGRYIAGERYVSINIDVKVFKLRTD